MYTVINRHRLNRSTSNIGQTKFVDRPWLFHTEPIQRRRFTIFTLLHACSLDDSSLSLYWNRLYMCVCVCKDGRILPLSEKNVKLLTENVIPTLSVPYETIALDRLSWIEGLWRLERMTNFNNHSIDTIFVMCCQYILRHCYNS